MVASVSTRLPSTCSVLLPSAFAKVPTFGPTDFLIVGFTGARSTSTIGSNRLSDFIELDMSEGGEFTFFRHGMFGLQHRLLEHLEKGEGYGALLPHRSGTTTAIAEYCGKHRENVACVFTMSGSLAEDLRQMISKTFGECRTKIAIYNKPPTYTGPELHIMDTLMAVHYHGIIDLIPHGFPIFDPMFTPKQFAQLNLGGTGDLIIRAADVSHGAVPPDARESSDGFYHWRRPCNMGTDLTPLINEWKNYVSDRTQFEPIFEFSCHTTSAHFLDTAQIIHIVQICRNQEPEIEEIILSI